MQVNRWQFQSPPCGFGGFDAGRIAPWTEHITGSTARSHWMPSLGEYLSRIAPVADMAMVIGAQTQKKHSQNTTLFSLQVLRWRVWVVGRTHTQNRTDKQEYTRLRRNVGRSLLRANSAKMWDASR
jgi:hypothetical protein